MVGGTLTPHPRLVTTAAPPRPADAPTGRLALALQEVLTATARLRAGRQPVTDVAAFRAQLRQLLASAEQDAIRTGYAPERARLATYAATTFVDESVLSTNQPVFAGWAQKPLQDELFGGHVGGEVFFQHLQQLLAAPDAPETADLLEVYQLCLLLGFRGRYGLGGAGELHAVLAAVTDKIRRIRGPEIALAPTAFPDADDAVPTARDPWVRRLAIAAAIAAVVAVALYAGLRSSLAGDVRAVPVVPAPALAA